MGQSTCERKIRVRTDDGIRRESFASDCSSSGMRSIHAAYFGLCMAVYVATFVLAAWLLRIPELEQSLAKVARRIPASVRNRIFRSQVD